MLLTLTPNPSLDLLFMADRLVWDDANRVPMPRRRAGGQGINLVRAVRALDPAAAAVAVAPLGGRTGAELRELLEAEGTPLRAVPMDGETRLFVGARERETGRSLLLNPRGPAAGDDLADRLVRAVEESIAGRGREGGGDAGGGGDGSGANGGGWVACCGSLLPGLPVELYAEVGRVAGRHGLRFVPDCDGPALTASAGVADLLVPNDMEAARLVGWAVTGPADAAVAGLTLLERHGRPAVITLGDRGAVAVTGAGAWWAHPELPAELAGEARQGSAVGAGDAFLAALLLGGGIGSTDPPETALVEAVATGTAVLLGRGATLVDPADVDRVRPHVRLERLPG